MSITVTAFYKFVRIEDCALLRVTLHQTCADLGILGTILLAPEGINATVSGSTEAIAQLHTHLRSDPRFARSHNQRVGV